MPRLRLAPRPLHALAVLLALPLVPAPLLPGQEPIRPGIQVQVTEPTQRLELIANTSRILTLQHKVPRVAIDDESVARVLPVAENQVQVAALKPGFTQLTIWDQRGGVFTVDIVVMGDARELENLLASEFPDATLRVRPLASSVVVSGHVPRPDMVHRIVTIAEDYYPKVINNISVSGAQEILLHVRVMEVSRTKLRKLGIDWAYFNADDGIISNAAGLIGNYTLNAGGAVTGGGAETLAVGIVNGSSRFFAFIEALRRYNLVKVMADPTLVTVSGRPASFNVGGEFPIPVPQQLGTISIQYREFGTRVDFVPIVLGNGNIRLEVRPQVSEVDSSRGVTIGAVNVPGLRTRWADTGVEMRAGQTLAIAGLVQTQLDAENRGLPWLSDLPYLGAFFRRVQMTENEIELLIMVTPEFADAMDPHEVPPCGPGQMTTVPGDSDLYNRGILEVPGCCENGPGCAIHGTNLPGGASSHGEYPTQGYGQRSAPSLLGPAANFGPSTAPEEGMSRRFLAPPPSAPRNTTPRAEVTAQPASNAAPQKRYFQQSPHGDPRNQRISQAPPGPGIIGPVGYDVSK